MSLRLKILFYIILTTAVVFILSVGFVNYKYWLNAKKYAIQTANFYSKQTAISAKSILQQDLQTVITLENIFSSFQEYDINEREEFYNKILVDVLRNNREYLSVWMSWELSSIDPQWQFTYGRKRTVAFWQLGNIKLAVDSVNLNGDVPGSMYYQLKQGIERTLLSNPYLYSYSQDTGSTFLETSIARGIFVGDRFVGAVGIDVSLQRFYNLIQQIKPFPNTYIKIISNNGTIVASDKKNEIGQDFLKIYPYFKAYNVSKYILNGNEESFFYKVENEQYFISFSPILVSDSDSPWSLAFIIPSNFVVKDIKNMTFLMLALSLVALLVISLIIWAVLSSIIKPISKTTFALEQLSRGVISEDIKVDLSSRDEMGRMAKAVNKLINTLIATQSFAIEIGKGNLDVKHNQLSYEDVLGKSLVEMRDNIRKSKQEEKRRLEESEELSWMQNGITMINEILRENSDDLNNLTYSVIRYIVKYTKSIQGGFYLLETKENKTIIVLKAAFAYERRKELKAEIEIGEGLIGRAVQEKKMLYLNDLPQGYTYVQSGLGDATPDKLLIMPLMFEDTVLGAIELAGFNEYSETAKELISQMSVRISSSVSILMKTIETENLLKESQLQTATFEIKEKQFVRTRKKVAEQKKQLKEKEQLLGNSLNAIKNIGIYIELDFEKKIIDINEFLPRFFETPKNEIIGKSIDEISIFVKGSKIWQEKFWEDVENGKIRKKITKYSYNNHEIDVYETFFSATVGTEKKIYIVGIEKQTE